MRYFLLLVLLLPGSLLPAQSIQLDTDSSYVAYTGHHPLHSWTGVSHTIRASIVLNIAKPESSRVTIAIPVETFDSGNSNRDSNMLEVVEADRYPEVTFVMTSATLDSLYASSDARYHARWLVRGNLTFHGVTRPVEVPVEITVEGNQFRARTAFSLRLSDFRVRRPRLLLTRIRDEIDIEAYFTGIVQQEAR